jgi:hypothetical protein
MVPDLAKHFFHGPVLAPVPGTSLRELRGGFGLQEPDPEPAGSYPFKADTLATLVPTTCWLGLLSWFQKINLK